MSYENDCNFGSILLSNISMDLNYFKEIEYNIFVHLGRVSVVSFSYLPIIRIMFVFWNFLQRKFF